MLLLGTSNDLIAEHDADLALRGLALHGLEPRFLGSLGLAAVDVRLELRHEEEQGSDRDRPQDQDREQHELISRQSSHASQSVRA